MTKIECVKWIMKDYMKKIVTDLAMKCRVVDVSRIDLDGYGEFDNSKIDIWFLIANEWESKEYILVATVVNNRYIWYD